MIKTNIYPRLLALMIIMIMSAGGVWGATTTKTAVISWMDMATSGHNADKTGVATFKADATSANDYITAAAGVVGSTLTANGTKETATLSGKIYRYKCGDYSGDQNASQYFMYSYTLLEGTSFIPNKVIIGWATSGTSNIKIYLVGVKNGKETQIQQLTQTSDNTYKTDEITGVLDFTSLKLYVLNAKDGANVILNEVTIEGQLTYPVPEEKTVTDWTFNVAPISIIPGQQDNKVKDATATVTCSDDSSITLEKSDLTLSIADTQIADLYNNNTVVIGHQPGTTTLDASVPASINKDGIIYNFPLGSLTKSVTITVGAQEELTTITDRMRWTFGSTGGTNDNNNTYITSFGSGKSVIKSTIDATENNTLVMYGGSGVAMYSGCAYNRGGFYQVKTSGRGKLKIYLHSVTGAGDSPSDGSAREFVVRTICSDHVATTTLPFQAKQEYVINYNANEERLITISDPHNSGGHHHNIYYIEWTPAEVTTTITPSEKDFSKISTQIHGASLSQFLDQFMGEVRVDGVLHNAAFTLDYVNDQNPERIEYTVPAEYSGKISVASTDDENNGVVTIIDDSAEFTVPITVTLVGATWDGVTYPSASATINLTVTPFTIEPIVENLTPWTTEKTWTLGTNSGREWPTSTTEWDGTGNFLKDNLLAINVGKSVSVGGYYIGVNNGGTLTAGAADIGFALKVSGNGKLSTYAVSQGASARRLYCYDTRTGTMRDIELQGNGSGAQTITFDYRGNGETTLYLYPNGGVNFQSITWTPDNVSAVTSTTEKVTVKASETTPPSGTTGQFDVAVYYTKAGESVNVILTKSIEGKEVWLSKTLTEAEVTSLDESSLGYVSQGIANPVSFVITAPAIGHTDYYKVKVAAVVSSAPSRAIADEEVYVLAVSTEPQPEQESGAIGDLETITTDFTWIPNDDNLGDVPRDGSGNIKDYLFQYKKVFVLLSQHYPQNTTDAYKVMMGETATYPILNSKIENRYVAIKVAAGAKVSVYGRVGSGQASLAICSTNNLSTTPLSVGPMVSNSGVLVTYSNDTGSDQLLYIGGIREKSSGGYESNDTQISAIKVTFSAQNPEWRWRHDGTTITNLDVLAGVDYNLKDALYNPYDGGDLNYTYELSNYSGITASDVTINGNGTATTDGKLIINIAKTGSVRLRVSYKKDAVTYQSDYITLQARSATFSEFTLTALSGAGETADLSSKFSTDHLSYTYPDTYTAATVSVRVKPASQFQTNAIDGFSIKLNDTAMEKDGDYYTGTLTLPCSNITLTITDGRNTTQSGVGAYLGTVLSKDYTITLKHEKLTVVADEATWEEDSWTNQTVSSVDGSSNHLIQSSDVTGYSMIAYDRGASGNYDITFTSSGDTKYIKLGGAPSVSGSWSASNLPDNRAIEFKVNSSGTLYVKMKKGSVSGQKLQLSYLDKDGVWHADAENQWDTNTEYDGETKGIQLTNIASAAKPARLFLYSKNSGIEIESIHWVPLLTQYETGIVTRKTEDGTTFNQFSVEVGAIYGKSDSSYTRTITVRDNQGSGENITDQGVFTVEGCDNISILVQDNTAYIVGEKVGTKLQPKIKWTPKDPKYTACSITMNGGDSKSTVTKGTLLAVSFNPSSGTVLQGNSIVPPVKLIRKDGREVTGLADKITFTSTATDIVSISGGVAVGKAVGSSTITASFAGNDNYNAMSNDASAYGTANYTLTVETVEAAKERNLVMIPHRPDYYSPNMADYYWYDDSPDVEEGSDNIRYAGSTPMSRLHSYLSSDNKFRVYSTANDEFVNNATTKGVFLKEFQSWIGFYAQGTATLTVKGYATTPRVLELYAVNDKEYADYLEREGLPAGSDPDLSNAQLIKTYVLPSVGEFTWSELIAQPSRNYYFLKTSVGGVYISTIDWTDCLLQPYVTIKNVNGRNDGGTYTQKEAGYYHTIYDDTKGSICQYAMDATTGALRITDIERLQIKAWTYESNNPEPGSQKYIIPTTQWVEGSTERLGNLKFSTSDESIAKVDDSGLVIPIKRGVCKLYVYLTAGEGDLYPADADTLANASGATQHLRYGAQRAEIELHINAEAVDVDFVDNLTKPTDANRVTEMVYSSQSSTNSNWEDWPQVWVSDHPGWEHVKYHCDFEYSILNYDGFGLRSEVASVMSITTEEVDLGGVLHTRYKINFASGADDVIEEGEQFRIAVSMSSDHYVNQRAYYILTYTKTLTLPTVTFSGTGMKELDDPRGIKAELDATSATGQFKKWREYFAQAEHDCTLSFHLPSTTKDLTAIYNIYDELPTVTPDYNKWTDGSYDFKITIEKPNPYTYKEKYVCIHISHSSSSAKWDGVYKITFFKMPEFGTLSGSDSDTERTLKLISNNTAFNSLAYGLDSEFNIHYSTDTSDPTADDTKYSSAGIKVTGNTVFRIVEVFAAPDVLTLTDQYGNKTSTFSTGIPDDMVVRVKDATVMYCYDWSNAGGNWNAGQEPKQILITPTHTGDVYSGEFSRKYNCHELKNSDGTRTEVRLTLGVDGAPIYRSQDSYTKFYRGGNVLSEKPSQYTNLPYIDGYDYVVKSDDNKSVESYTMTANPFTEYNQGVADFLREKGGLYLTPMSGDFYRFEPEYSGIISVWVRQNGGGGSDVKGNVKKTNEFFDNTASKDADKMEKNSNYTALSSDEKKTLDIDIHRYVQYLKYCDLTRRPVYVMDEDGKMKEKNTNSFTNENYENINGVVGEFSQQTVFGEDLNFAWQHNWNMIKNGSDKLYPSNMSSDMKGSTSNRTITMAEIDAYIKDLTTNQKKVMYSGGSIDTQWNDYKAKYKGGSSNRNYNKVMEFYASRFGLDYSKCDVSPDTKIKEIVFCDNNTDTKIGESGEFSRYGYECPVTNLVRYRFPVTAGRTYFLTGRGTKEYFSAMKFDNDGRCESLETKTIDEDDAIISGTTKTNDWLSTTPAGTQMNVQLKRTFTAGMWHPIVLPFSVSESRMREIFGDEVKVLMLDTKFGYAYSNPYAVNGNKLTFTRHFYQMLYANVPAFVCPTFVWAAGTTDDITNVGATYNSTEKSKTNITFNRVTYMGNHIKEQTISSGGYVWTGSYTTTTATQNGDMYYLDNIKTTDAGNVNGYIAKLKHNPKGQKMRATRCWIKTPTYSDGSASAAPIRYVALGSFDEEEVQTNITDITEDDNFGIEDNSPQNPKNYTPTTVYNLQGQKVSEGSITNLSTGVYITNGRKIIVHK